MAEDIDVAELEAWAAGLAEMHARIAPRFARPEPRARVAAYVRGLSCRWSARTAGRWRSGPARPSRTA